MSRPGKISYECFRELIAQLRAAGHSSTADRLDLMINRVAWTSGSELLAELGVEILQFQRSTRSHSEPLRESLNRSLEMVQRVWPDLNDCANGA